MRDPGRPLLGEWLRGTGPDSDIVISSRIRLARNVIGFPLRARLGDEDEGVLCRHLKDRIGPALGSARLHYQNLSTISEIERLVLVERHVISLEHANADGERFVGADETGSVALMLNEEDHLRVQLLRSGLRIDELFEQSHQVSRGLEQVLDFAFHPRFGYLTSCPTNVGTGMRVSVMLHLPALASTKQIDKVFNAVSKMNLAVRGFYGEGTKALSDFYQISNQVTLGKAPDALLDDVRKALPKIIAFERSVREQLLKGDQSSAFLDKIWRALGTLRHARLMGSEEAFELLSSVRMGVHSGVLTGLDVDIVNELFMMIQPGHLQMSQGNRSLEAAQRDEVRARLIRERLSP